MPGAKLPGNHLSGSLKAGRVIPPVHGSVNRPIGCRIRKEVIRSERMTMHAARESAHVQPDATFKPTRRRLQ